MSSSQIKDHLSDERLGVYPAKDSGLDPFIAEVVVNFFKMIMYFKLCFFLSLSTRAQEANPQLPPTPLAQLKTDEGKVDFVFKDGRVATLIVENGEVRRIKVGLKPVENTCQPEITMPDCEFNLAFSQVRVALVWTKNPQSSRLGQILKYKKNNNPASETDSEEEFKDENFFTALMSQINLPVEGLSDQKTYLSCQNDLWLKDFVRHDGSVVFESISSELMFQNFETQVSENATFMEIYQPQFVKTSLLGWEFKSYKKFFGLIRNNDPFLSTQVSHFVLKNNSGENCHVAFTSDVSGIRQNLNDENFLKLNSDTRKPLLQWNLLMDSELNDKIRNILNPHSTNQQEIL